MLVLTKKDGCLGGSNKKTITFKVKGKCLLKVHSFGGLQTNDTFEE
jgi:hypothetical protein